MKPSDVRLQIKNSYQVREPLYIWGAPGVGKSDTMRQVAKELEINLIDQRLSQMDPTDLKGIPYVDEGFTKFAIPGFLPQVKRDGANGILFLDELGQAPPAIQSAGYQLILDGRLGDYYLPEGWVCMAAGNRAEDRAFATRLSSALADRFGHIDYDVNVDEWRQWAYKEGIDSSIISFINYRPAHLHNMDVQKRAFPTPRSWAKINKHLPLLTPDTEYYTFCAFIGEETAGEFIAYKRLADELPHIDEILIAPKEIKIPTNPSTLYATTGLLAANTSLDNFKTIMKFLTRMPVEYQTVYMTDVTSLLDDLEDHEDFAKWALKNDKVIL